MCSWQLFDDKNMRVSPGYTSGLSQKVFTASNISEWNLTTEVRIRQFAGPTLRIEQWFCNSIRCSWWSIISSHIDIQSILCRVTWIKHGGCEAPVCYWSQSSADSSICHEPVNFLSWNSNKRPTLRSEVLNVIKVQPPWWGVRPEKLIVDQLLNFSTFMEIKFWLLCTS